MLLLLVVMKMVGVCLFYCGVGGRGLGLVGLVFLGILEFILEFIFICLLFLLECMLVLFLL